MLDGIDARALRTALAELDEAVAPAGAKAVAVLLRKLFTVLPIPAGAGALAIWNERLRRYPADVLARAVDTVIDRHKWPRPPAIADLVECCEADGAYRQRWRDRARVAAAASRLPAQLAERRAEAARQAGRQAGRGGRIAPDTVAAAVARCVDAKRIADEAAGLPLPKLYPDAPVETGAAVEVAK